MGAANGPNYTNCTYPKGFVKPFGAIYDPTTCLPFPNNYIDPSRANPAAIKYFNAFPLPNVQGTVLNNYFTNPSQIERFDDFDVRFDANISSRDTLFVRYSYGQDDLEKGSLFPTLPAGFGAGANPTHPRGIAAGYTHTFSPNVVNEFRYGYLLQLRRGLSAPGPRSGRYLRRRAVWEIPDSRGASGLAGWARNGWQTGAIFQASTGSPFSVFIAGDPLGMNSTDPWDYPDRVSGSGCGNPVNPGNPTNYIKLSCFSAPVETVQTSNGPQQQIFRLGNAGRNELTGPGLAELDFSLVKNSKLAGFERGNVQFRAEVFNLLNRSNFAAPLDNDVIFNQDGTPADGAGAIDQTQTTSRQIQFGLKILF